MPIQLKHDGIFDIAIGRSAQEVSWKNRTMLFSELVEKLSVTHRTHETYAEYLASKKPRQDSIKDVGGYVGGYLASGRRKSGNVLHRQLVTLDIDQGAQGMWEEFTMMYGNAAVCYSTHKHCPEKPRLRLILPLDREVGPDEYEAISRRIAGNLGIENFDPTTFQPSRLMYWPSTSKDGVYQFDYQDGAWVNADAVLKTYHNWKDASEWPISARFNTIMHRNIAKQGDPLEKPGVVGAFCRTYSIEEAIDTFLSDVYTACDVPGRYTYKEGSTSAGLVIYEDRYTFSHHGTDPTSMKLCNAFDLVRIHKFGLRDEDAREGTPINKMPSFTAMVDFAHADTKVRRQYGIEKFADALAEFADEEPDPMDANPADTEDDHDPIEPELPLDMEWLTKLDMDKKGNYYATLDNIVIVLENDPRLKGRIMFDVFNHREVVKDNLPWRKVTPETSYLSDRDMSNLRHYFEKFFNIASAPKIEDGLAVILEKHQFHPVKEYLTALVWDGEPRIDTLLIDYLGVADNAYTRAVTRKTLAAAVTRIFRPGCKFDYVLTLVGRQGVKKSTLISKLGGRWFSDSFTTVLGKEAYEQLLGAWLIEVAELSGMRKADVETVKHFVAKQADKYRSAYATRPEDHPRQCIFIASTNDRISNKDLTGGRRWWFVDVHEFAPRYDVSAITEAEVAQIWAEAVQLYKKGEKLYLPPALETMAREVQEEHTETDVRMGMVQRYLDTPVTDNWETMSVYERRAYLAGDELQVEGTIRRDRVCATEICVEVFNMKESDLDRWRTKPVWEILQMIPGWRALKGRQRFGVYGTQRGFERVKVNELKTT